MNTTDWQTVTDMERNIQDLEAWAANCADGSTQELKGIIIQKINTLINRLERTMVLLSPEAKS